MIFFPLAKQTFSFSQNKLKKDENENKRYGVLQRSVVLGVLMFLTNVNTQREINFISCLRTIQRTNICFLLRVGDKEGSH